MPLLRPTVFEWQLLIAFDQTEEATFPLVYHAVHLPYSRPINEPRLLDGHCNMLEHSMMSPYCRAGSIFELWLPIYAAFEVVA